MRKLNVINRFLLSYLVILAIPLSTMLLLYNRSQKSLEQEILFSHKAVLQQLRLTMDGNLESLQQMSLQMQINESYQSLFELTSLDSVSRISLYQKMTELRYLITSNAQINSLNLHLKKINYILSPEGGLSLEKRYTFDFENQGWSIEEWLQLFEQRETDSLELINNNLCYIRSLPEYGSKESPGNIIILLNKENYQTTFDESETLTGLTVLLLNDKKQIILSSRGGRDIDPDLLSFSQSTGRVAKDGEVHIYTSLPSNVGGLTYISLIPEKKLMRKLLSLRNTSLSGLVVCLILAALLIRRSLKQNYDPIREITRYIGSHVNMEGMEYKEEFSYIRDALHRSVDNVRNLESELDSQQLTMKNLFLSRLLQGQIGDREILENRLDMYRISFDSPYFLVASLLVDQKNEKTDSYWTDVLPPMGEKLSPREGFWTVEIHDALFLLFNLENNDQKRIRRLLEKFPDKGQENTDLILNVGLSGIHEFWSAIPQAFQEAQESQEYLQMTGRNGLIEYAETRTPMEEGNIRELYRLENSLIALIKAEEFGEAGKFLDIMFTDYYYKENMRLTMVRCHLFGLINSVIKVFSDLPISMNSAFLDSLKPVERILKLTGADDLHREMDLIFSEFDKQIKKERKKTALDLKNEIVSHVNKNYADPNLNVSSIADMSKKSIDYISRFFKEKTKTNLLDYINQTRIEKSLVLLKESRLPVKEVARKVGYTNVDSFIRIFSKYQGVTPGKYRKMSISQ